MGMKTKVIEPPVFKDVDTIEGRVRLGNWVRVKYPFLALMGNNLDIGLIPEPVVVTFTNGMAYCNQDDADATRH